MMQPPPPEYQSQAQLYGSSGRQGNYSGQIPPSGVPSQPYRPQQNRGPESFLDKFLCCCKGKSAVIRYLSIVLGAIIVLHGVIAIIIAIVGIAQESDYKPTVPNDPTHMAEMEHYNDGVLIYGIFASVIKAFAIGASRYIGGIFGAILSTIIDEVLPGACLIGAAVLLMDIFCLVSILPFVILFLLNVAEIFAIIVLGALALSAPRDSCRGDKDCGFTEIVGLIFGFMLIRFIGCIFITVCIIVALGLRQQIKNGAYGARRQHLFAPPPATQSVTVTETAIGEKPDSAAEAARPTEDPIVENN